MKNHRDKIIELLYNECLISSNILNFLTSKDVNTINVCQTIYDLGKYSNEVERYNHVQIAKDKAELLKEIKRIEREIFNPQTTYTEAMRLNETMITLTKEFTCNE